MEKEINKCADNGCRYGLHSSYVKNNDTVNFEGANDYITTTQVFEINSFENIEEDLKRNPTWVSNKSKTFTITARNLQIEKSL